MNDFEKTEAIYFLGIGGIGMSALARYFIAGGFTVAGYDRTSGHRQMGVVSSDPGAAPVRIVCQNRCAAAMT